MTARLALIAYLGAVVLGTTVHHLGFLAVALTLVLLAAGRRWFRILRRACVAVLLFNLVVTVSYVLLASFQGTFSMHYVALVNLRVLFLTSLTFLFTSRVNPFEALAFSRGLTYLLALAYGQVMTLTRVLSDFHMAYRSRSIRPAKLRERYRHAAGTGVLLLDKSMHTATEITHAMRSRGFFDD